MSLFFPSWSSDKLKPESVEMRVLSWWVVTKRVLRFFSIYDIMTSKNALIINMTSNRTCGYGINSCEHFKYKIFENIMLVTHLIEKPLEIETFEKGVPPV